MTSPIFFFLYLSVIEDTMSDNFEKFKNIPDKDERRVAEFLDKIGFLFIDSRSVFKKSESEEELWTFVGEEKHQRYKKTFDEIKNRGISFDTINGIQLSRLTEYEKAVVLDAMRESVNFVKYKSAEMLYKMDQLKIEIKDEIRKSDLSQNEKDSILSDFDFYTDSKRTETINALGNSIITMQSSLSIQESPQKIGSDINSYYNAIANKQPPVSSNIKTNSKGGGCLIATATYGSELAPQVQQLRELRDNSLLQTASGTSFMVGFNQFYYSFSPTIADWERESPVFKEMVKITLTPMISSLSILNYVDMDSEASVLGYGISLIMLNVGMYFVAPVIVIHTIRKKV